MKRFKKMILVLVFVLAFPLEISAREEGEDYIKEFESILPDGSELQAEELISGIGVDKLLSVIFSSVSEHSGEVVGFFLMLLGLGLLFSLGDFSLPVGNRGISAAVRAGISAISALLVFSRLRGLVFSVEEGLSVISSFFSSLIPIITGISLASGAVTTASIQAINMNLTLGIIGKLSSSVLLPMVFMIFALALTSSVGDGGAGRIAKGVRSVFNWLLGILTTLLVASISMQSFLAVTKDNTALRAAKFALSGSIPIVGATVSGALATLTGALSEAGGIVGIGAVFVIFTMAASPIIIMLLYRLALSASISVFEFVGAGSVNPSFSAFRSALDVLISVYAISAVVYILEIVIFIRGGVNVFV